MSASPTPYQVIVEHVPDGIVFRYEEREGELRYTFVGGDGLDEIGLGKAELEGEIVAKDRPQAIREQVHSQYRKALDGEEVVFETEAEGRHFRFKLRPVHGASGEITCAIGIAQDITEQVVYQQELERQNERLEGLTDLVFHDIRNPLNVAQMYLDLIREDCDSEHIDTIADALERIESLTSRETSLVDYQVEESGKELRISTVAQDAWQNVATKSADLRLETDRTVCANPEDLRRLFENLFRNAVDHGGEDVTVTVGYLGSGFYVEDDGPGIPSEDQETIFERGVSMSQSGTGLGLFIVERIVDSHGWNIVATDGQHGGARFEITEVQSSC